MFIPRADGDSDGCGGHVSCTPSTGSIAITGDQSGDTDGNSSTYYRNNKPGVHRFIGIAMVIVLVFVALCSWLYYVKRSRATRTGSKGAYLICCGSRKTTPSTSEEALCDKPITRAVLEKERSMMLQSEPRGLIKEVSGGVVMFTEAPRAALLPSKDRYPMGWEFEHVDGVRFEVTANAPPSWKKSNHTKIIVGTRLDPDPDSERATETRRSRTFDLFVDYHWARRPKGEPV